MSVSLMFACNFKAVALAGGVGARVQIYMQTNKTSYYEVIADGAGILLGSFCMLSYWFWWLQNSSFIYFFV